MSRRYGSPIDPLTGALASYRPRGRAEAEDVGRIMALVPSGDPWARDRPLHVTASALIIHPDSGRVLLRWHSRMRRWLQVGGHGDPGESDPWEIACREAREETGLDDLVAFTPELARRLVQVVIVPVPASGRQPAHEHADLRYLLATARPEEAVPESPASALKWMAVSDAETQVEEENLREFLRRVEALLAAVGRGA